MKTKTQPKVQRYAGCIIVTRPTGADVIDPTTGVWQTFPTMRSAKWSATIFTRLASSFGHDVASPDLIDSTLNQVKEHNNV